MKLAISHSKKIPGAEDYSSEGFSCALEIEIPEETARYTETLRRYLTELYSEAKAAVEQQLAACPGGTGMVTPKLPAYSADPMATSPSVRATASRQPRSRSASWSRWVPGTS